MNQSEIQQIIQEQRSFFQTQATKSIRYRIKQLTRLEKMLHAYEPELLVALSQDLGKAPTESYTTELGLVYHSIQLLRKKLPKWANKQRVPTPIYLQPANSYTQPSPYGTVLIMSAFNYPVLLSLDPLVGALAAGNTVVLALSEQTPKVNAVLLSALKAFFPPTEIFAYQGNQSINTLVLAERFDKIFFTGSQRVGRIVHQAANKWLTPTVLELGGKSPAILLKDAKVELAAERIAWGKFMNVGATCVAPDYILLPKEMANEFVEQLEAKLLAFYGEDYQKSPDYARLVSQMEWDRLASLVTADRAYLYKGGKGERSDLYFEPTLLIAPLGTPLQSMETEIFGPILPVLTYESIEQVKDFLHQKASPLAFYIFTSNRVVAEQWLLEFSFGGATINDCVLQLSNSALPFGGIGASGMGQYHGRASFEVFTHQKAVLVRKNYAPLKIMYPPYSPLKEKIIRFFLR